MTTLKTTLERNEAFKTMEVGQHYFKCGLWIYNLGWGADYELVGYAFAKDIEEAKEMFLKELEDDEEATIEYYMHITPYKFVGAFINEKGLTKHAKKDGDVIINDFGKWITKKEFFKEHYGVDIKG